MKITEIETLTRGPLAVVRVRTDDGAEGIGQAAPYEADTTVRVLHTMVAPMFLGRDPWDAEALVDECLRTHYKLASSFLHRAVAGVETALWDVMGKAAGRPVCQLLGGRARATVPMYASSMSRTISPEDEAERLGGLIAEQGFRAVKIRVGEAMGRDGDAAPGRTERIIGHLREVLGPDADLSADANGGFSVPRAIRVGRMLEEHGYFHFEEPCPFPDLEATAQVAAALDIAVSGGEQDFSLPQFNRMIATRSVDIVQPDIGYIGGVSRARKVAVLAEAAGIPCTPHCANDSLLRVFSLHLAAAMPSCIHPQEWSIETTPWTQDVYGPMPQVTDGAVPVPTAPGWGIELLPSFVHASDHALSRL
ncbi:mandelate racemase/muconate lactonizing enzyme family protein [Nonomuraea sp. K274]|uniref:Mandelate racemase/muconate lactonizing enzyme family protein n=1 Tax=Nonomuraea cypriaca TaxID=1187855 RepID=A0A931EXQ1_9ACTN|nr:mandelate racemase/muconate lactonizing enzyme family protein [Nonomuraea cypriaca]MBF8185707.1 mandelate racemase/muconate lactonizing enzyme family protein [Nonomuraea cypriaca]